MSKLKALPGDVFIECQVRPAKVGLIHLPSDVAMKDLPMVGHVRSVGGFRRFKDGTTKAPDFAVGDRVIFKRYSGTLLAHEGVTLMKVKQHDIHATLGEEVEVGF